MFKTKIIARDNKTGNEVLNTENTNVLGGRIDLLDRLFGKDVDPSKHIYLDEILKSMYPGITFSDSAIETHDGTTASHDVRKVKYFAIGNEGVSAAATLDVHDPLNHETSLYGWIPFRTVVTASAEEAAVESSGNYAMKCTILNDGISYSMYFLKKINVNSVSTTTGVVKSSGSSNDVDYVPEIADSVVGNSPDYVVNCKVDLEILIEEEDVTEYFDMIASGSTSVDRNISEFGLVVAKEHTHGASSITSDVRDAELFSKACHDRIPMGQATNTYTIDYTVYS